MIKIDSRGRTLEPATRSDLIAEIVRLTKIIRQAIFVISKTSQCEADVFRIALRRETPEQPDVENRPDLDVPVNAGDL